MLSYVGVRRRIRVLVFAAVVACEDHYTSTPPTAPESYPSMSSTSRVAALFAPVHVEAGAAVASSPSESPHALTIASCASSPGECSPASADAGADATYRVVFGSGRVVVRLRAQAMTDLYNELRDRTTAGERLDATPHAPQDPKPRAEREERPHSASSAAASDPIAKGAIELLDLVDDIGEVTIDVVHASGLRGCTVSVKLPSADGGASQCLIQATEQPHRAGQGRRGR